LVLGALPSDAPRALIICVYRSAQESLTNAFRHAGGLGQRIEAFGRAGVIAMSVSDRGMNAVLPAPAPSGAHLGLRGIRNRVLAFDGKLDFRSEPGVGTIVKVTLPLASRRKSQQQARGH